MVLAGTAVMALFVSFTQGMLVVNEVNLDRMLQWIAGTVANRTLEVMLPMLPILLIAMIIAAFMARPINIMNSGDDIAKGLGQNLIVSRFKY